MEFKSFFVMALLAGLFIFCFISFSYNLSTQNNATVNINQNDFVSNVYVNVNTSLANSEEIANATKKDFEKEKGVAGILGFALESILNAAKTFISSTVNLFGYMFTFSQEIFKLEPMIMGTILAIVIGLLVLAGWSLIRAGR